jgi:hypothetical protein
MLLLVAAIGQSNDEAIGLGDGLDIVPRQHRDDARQRSGMTRVDGIDLRMRMRASHERSVQCAIDTDVVDEPSLAAK